MGFLSNLFGRSKKNLPENLSPSAPPEKPIPEPVRGGTTLRKQEDLSPQPEQKDGPELTALELAERQSWEVKRLPRWKKGKEVLGLYRIEDVIETGGMGRVYIAHHKGWNVKLAIKAPNEMMLSDRNNFARVLREANSWTELGLHPNIAYCYYVRSIEDVPHIFVEYLDGGNLEQWIQDGKCIDYRVSLDLAIQFCHGMEHAHSKEMIHRDIKPKNVLMTKDGILKVTDFGLVRTGTVIWDQKGKAGVSGKGMTRLGDVMGTEGYMAPEQFTDPAGVDERVDIFSFGVCLYEMYCGARPYDTTIGPHQEAPDPVSLSRDPKFPQALSEVLRKCVQWERDKRYGTFKEIRERLNAIYRELFNQESPYTELELVDLEADSLNNRGVSYFELGRKENALNCWLQALNINPTHPESTYNLSLLEWRDSQIDDIQAAEKIELLKKNPAIDTNRIDEIQAYINSERLANTIKKIGGLYFNPEERIFLGADQEPAYLTCGRYLLLVESIEEGGLYESLNEEDANNLTYHAAIFAFKKKIEKEKKSQSKIFKEMILNDFKCLSDIKNLSIKPGGGAFGREVIPLSKKYCLFIEREKIGILDVNSKRTIRTLHDGALKSIVITPDKKYVIFFQDRLSGLFSSDGISISVWDLNLIDGNCAEYILSKPRNIENIKNDKIRVKDIVQEAERLYFNKRLHEGYSMLKKAWGEIGFSDDREIIALYSKFCLKGVKKSLLTIVKDKEHPTQSVNVVAISSDAKIIVIGTGDNILQFIEVKSGKCSLTLEGHTKKINSVAISANDKYIVSGSDDGKLMIWDSSTGKYVNPPESNVRKTVYSEKDKEVIAESLAIRAITYGISSVAVNSCGNYALSGSHCYLLSGGLDVKYKFSTNIKLWDLSSGAQVKVIEDMHQEGITSVAFSPEGEYGVSGSEDKTIKVWNIETGRCVKTIRTTHYIGPLAVSSNGQYILCGESKKSLIIEKINKRNPKNWYRLLLFDLRSGALLRTMENGHEMGVNSIAISPDGKCAVSCSEDHTIKIWDIQTGKCYITITKHTMPVNAVAISQDGNLIVSGSQDKTLIVWRAIWDLEFPDPVDWDEGVRPYLNIFLTLRKGKWSEEDFKVLIDEMASKRGYGWVRPEGIRKELEKMTKEYAN